MPPCPISSPPPALALALPWEVPSQYEFLAAMIVVYSVMIGYVYVKAPRPLTRRARIALSVVVAACVTFLAGTAIQSLVFTPYVDHTLEWVIAQTDAFYGQPCSLAAEYARQQGVVIFGNTWGQFVFAAVMCGLAAYGIGLQFFRIEVRRPTVEMSGT